MGKLEPLSMRLRRFCAFLTGFVFFISGIFKLLDPVGAGLVMSDYYKFFKVEFLEFSAMPVAVFLALLETVTGAALITGVWRKVTAIAASALMAYFTLLSAVLVIFNPVMDCGCFGEVIHLTHMQTFLKNIVLCVLLFAAYFPYREFGQTRKRKFVAFPMVMLAVLAFAGYSLVFIPLVDYTDFRPASRLMAAERAHESEGEEDMFEYVLVYEKEGRTREFTLEDIPDSTWTFVESRAVPKAGYRQEVFPELTLKDASGEYCDQLAVAHNVMIVSVYDVDMKKEKWGNVAGFLERAGAEGFSTLLVTASYPEALTSALESSGLDPQLVRFIYDNAYYGDYKTLISMNRSNAGVTYFDHGFLVRKWSYLGTPDEEGLAELASGDIMETLLDFSTTGEVTFKGFLLYCFAVMLLL